MNRVTLLDFAKSKDPDGSQAQVYELMNQYNPALQDGPAYPSNAPMGNRTTYRRRLPAVGTAKLNKGVAKSKSETDQRTDVIGYFAGRSEIDRRIMKIEGQAAYLAKRQKEDRAFEEALAQLVANNFLYGDTKNDEASFDGLAIRLGTANEGASTTSSQVWSMGSVTGGDACSLYIVDWGEDATHFIYPPNTVAGLDIQDKPDISVKDDDGAEFQADVTLYDWFVGLAVEDPRRIARLRNIDLSDAKLDSPTQGKILDKLEEIFAFMPDPGPNQRVIYCPFALYSAFSKQARSAANLSLSIEDYLGKKVPHFHGAPLRKMEQQSTTETV